MALTKAQRSAIAKKAARTRKRNQAKGLTPRRKTRTTRTTTKTSFLSEFVTQQEAKASFRAVMNGALGAIPAVAIEKIATNQNPTNQGLIMIATGFGIGALGKAPQAGAGCAAIGVYKILETTGMLNDDNDYLQDYDYADPLENMPMVLNDDNLYDDAPYSDYGVGYYKSGQGFGY